MSITRILGFTIILFFGISGFKETQVVDKFGKMSRVFIQLVHEAHPCDLGNIKNRLSFIALPIEQYIPHLIEKRYSRVGTHYKKY